MTTVDSLLKLYKKLCGKDYAYEVDPTDAEVIDKIAEDAETGEGSGVEAKIGDLDDLDTTDKTNLVAAINEVAESGGGSGGGITIAVHTNLETDEQTIDPLPTGLTVANFKDVTLAGYGTYEGEEVLMSYMKAVAVSGGTVEIVIVFPTPGEETLGMMTFTYNSQTGDIIRDNAQDDNPF